MKAMFTGFVAIVVIGVVGLVLEQLLVALAKAFTYEQVNN